jgi:hypothetical protein
VERLIYNLQVHIPRRKYLLFSRGRGKRSLHEIIQLKIMYKLASPGNKDENGIVFSQALSKYFTRKSR